MVLWRTAHEATLAVSLRVAHVLGRPRVHCRTAPRSCMLPCPRLTPCDPMASWGAAAATTEVYVVDFAGDGDAAQLSSTIELPARVLAISGIEGPPPFTTPVDFNDTSTVAFCSDTGSFGGGVARINVGNFSDVAWVNESLWVYFQGCAGNPTTGNVYLIDGGSGSGQGMNIRFVVPGSTVLSLQLELPVHTFLPGGDSVTVDVVVDDAAQLLYVSGVYKPDVARVSAAEAPFGWQWGVTIVSLANFDVQATLPVAPAVVSSSSVNSLQKLIVGAWPCGRVLCCAHACRAACLCAYPTSADRALSCVSVRRACVASRQGLLVCDSGPMSLQHPGGVILQLARHK